MDQVGMQKQKEALAKRSKALSERSKEISQRRKSGSITAAEAKELRAQLKSERPAIADERESLKSKKAEEGPGTGGKCASNLGFLFGIDELTTTVVQRQYLPIEKDIGDVEKDIAELVRLKIEGRL